jgi:RHS repeat-associated protein
MASSRSGELLSLPKGGGALRGLGETFSPDPFTGTGSFTVPITLPAGRNGLEPGLSLTYNNGTGSGPYGLGWSLAVPGVTRRTNKGIPRYVDEPTDPQADVFILSGLEDLVPVDGGPPGAQRYRPRTEGLFALIDRFHDAANDYWRVKTRDGRASVYGTEASVGADPAAVARPDDRRRVFAWKLTRTEDPFGNRIEYDYARDTGESGPHRWDQLYLKRVRYGDYTKPNGTAEFMVSVTFLYDDEQDPGGAPTYAIRPDPFSEYRAGFEIRTRRRCKRIVVRTRADAERLTRAYELVYLDERDDIPDLAGLLPPNRVSLLSQIHVIGYDDAGRPARELPPLEFAYSRFEPEKRSFFPITGAELPGVALSGPDMDLVDLFGRGLPDILEMNGTVRYWRNLGGGRFDLPRSMPEAPAGLHLADTGVQLIDANGDGRVDLLVTGRELPGYYSLSFRGVWDRNKSFQRYQYAPTFDLEDPEVRLVDLDGDGVTDAIRAGTRLECFFNHPQRGWQPGATRFVERRGLIDFPNVQFSDARVRLADMSGDGLQDIVLVHDGNVEYWPNLGYGDWGPRVSMEHAPRFAYDWDPGRILLADVDGDGLADLLYVEDRKVTLWINRGGGAWSDPIAITGTPPVSSTDSIRAVDLLGAGVAGVLWTVDPTVDGRPRSFFLDFTGGTKPYLLTEMDNHLGAVTRVGYAPSTRFCLADGATRSTAWTTPLPFPVQVVERVQVADEISGGRLTTEYRYHHGYWDGAEREFRGFGMVEQLDLEVRGGYVGRGLPRDEPALGQLRAEPAASAPVLTRTWFHLGPVGEESGEWADPDYSSEFWSGDAPLLDHKPRIDAFLAALPARRVRRDALRALRGCVLRTELYALDGSAREGRPYVVTESAYALREIQPPGMERERPRVFFPHVVAQRTTQWERGDEPKTTFSYTSDYDDYGQPRRTMAVACPRGWRKLSDALPETYITTIGSTQYAVPLDANVYIRDRIAKTTGHEIVNPPGAARTLEDIKRLAETEASRRLIAQSLSFYDIDPAVPDYGAFVGLPFGQVGRYGAVVRTDTLAMTDDMVQVTYGGTTPPYLVPGATMTPTPEYPAEFVTNLPALAGYAYRAGGPLAPHVRGYFVVIGTRYDFHNTTGTGRGLVVAQRDARSQETAIVYDEPYHLLPVAITDPANMTTLVAYDYRVMQVQQVTDPNGNVSRFVFTPTGLVKEMWVEGNPAKTEGDRTAPSLAFEYSLRAFHDQKQPAFVRAVKRVLYDTDPDDVGETMEAREYSDGFGRVLQARTQADEVVFGNPGRADGLLPADQADEAGSRAPFSGRRNADATSPNVTVSAWKIHDSKGRVIESYEPFFSTGWGLQSEAEARQGARLTMHYDPRGQVVRTVYPDGSEQRLIYGVAVNLDDPDDPAGVAPSPWEGYTYDANDNAGRTHAADSLARRYRHHWNTPTSVELDPLGRIVKTVARHREPPGVGASLPPIEEYVRRSAYDVQGHLLAVTDALGRDAFRYAYDLTGHVLRTESIDAGVELTVFDAAGNVVESRDAKGAITLRSFDALNRPIRVWARDDANGAVTLREKLIYGDDPSLTGSDPARSNRLGKVFEHFDEAGLTVVDEYDFRGNVLESSRRVISDDFMLADVRTHTGPTWALIVPRVDWAAAPATVLDATTYRTKTAFDALNRVRRVDYPVCANGERYGLRPMYGRAGKLARVELEGPLGAGGTGPRQTYVERLAWNAKGQRTLIVYGNGVMTRYAYDDRTFRLERLRTEPFTSAGGLTYQPTGAPLQDLAHLYDLAGNLLETSDRTAGCGVAGNLAAAEETDVTLRQLLMQGDALIRRYDYDPLYRLTAATGRACKDIPRPRPWSDDQRCGFDSGRHGTPDQDNAPNLAALYREEYGYDVADNMISLRHWELAQRAGAAAWGVLWSRSFGMGGFMPNPSSNRLTHVREAASGVTAPLTTPQTRDHDDSGNLIRENGARYYEWDHVDRLKAFRVQAGTSEPSTYSLYLYDSAGQRVKKLVRSQGGRIETTVYAARDFEHARRIGAAATVENNRVHVVDDVGRIASVRVGGALPGDGAAAAPVLYELGDHLRSSVVVVSADRTWVNREEFFPYGETSFGSYGRKRYRFAGKERDEDSGLHYHGARYYASWAARWCSGDPLAPAAGLNPYSYANDNPLALSDPSGRQNEKALEPKTDPALGTSPEETGGGPLELELKSPQAPNAESLPVEDDKGPNISVEFEQKDLSIGHARFTDAKPISKNLSMKPSVPGQPDNPMPHANIEVHIYDDKGKELPMTRRLARHWAVIPDPGATVEDFPRGWHMDPKKAQRTFMFDGPGAVDAPGWQGISVDDEPFGQLQEFLAGNAKVGGVYYQVWTLQDANSVRTINTRAMKLSAEEYREVLKLIDTGAYAKTMKDRVFFMLRAKTSDITPLPRPSKAPKGAPDAGIPAGRRP